ncbi:MAG: carbohydrate kinase [Erysipelotrichaceae bacterium]|nr:carbohydrate kinase [Erysipelotrichaceae bacterium]
MKYYLGLDNGGTTTKAALFDIEGKQICVVSNETRTISEKPGFVERDLNEIKETVYSTIRTLLEKTSVKVEDISGIGICGHGKGLYLVDENGDPVRNGILSTDNRAYRYTNQWAQDGTEEKVMKISCQHIMPFQPVALLAWLKDNEYDSYKRIHYIFECKDYVRFILTGQANAEITDYSGANLLNLYTKDYDVELLKLFGIDDLKDALPPLCGSLDIVAGINSETAKQTGLLEGTPVIGGMFDIDACALGVGVIDENKLCMIAGTWSINEYIRKQPVTDGRVKMNSLFCLDDYYLVEESSPTSAGNHAWFVKQLLPEASAEARKNGVSIYDQMNADVEEVSPYEFVPVFLPFTMASNVHPNAKGSFVGISVSHQRKHLERSVYEGIAFCHRYHFEKLMNTRDSDIECIRLAGGATKSKVWTQMFADVMGYPIETIGEDETGALGCAIAVAASAKDYPSLEEAVMHMAKPSGRFEPNKDLKEIYDQKYDLYLKTIDALDQLWDPMQDLIEHSI